MEVNEMSSRLMICLPVRLIRASNFNPEITPNVECRVAHAHLKLYRRWFHKDKAISDSDHHFDQIYVVTKAFLEYRTQMLGSFNLEYLKDWHQRIGDPKGEEEREEVRMVMDLLCVILMSMSVLHNLVLLVMVDNNIGHLVKRVGDL
ncbi:2760_t:CDS:2 [Rhizophagus irregularis]|nr:2760_t:CDS:2 [Rhizophagus irregularis]